MNVLKRINTLRLERGWSIYRLSIEANLPQSTMINMFNRETLPSLSTLESLCGAFEISLSEFFREEPIEKIPEVEQITELYRSLDEKQAKLVLELMRALHTGNLHRK